MYIPPTSRPTDPAFARHIIEANPFALITTPVPTLQGSHLPVLAEWDEAGNLLRLVSHMARANPHWRAFEGAPSAPCQALCIFPGPHAYISPRWYPATPAGPGSTIPTWNYAAVHVLGTIQTLDADATRAHVIALTERFEGPNTLDMTTVDRLIPAIVAFTITPTRIDTTAKMSMNKDATTFASVIAGLEAGGNPDDQRVAAIMRQLRPDAVP